MRIGAQLLQMTVIQRSDHSECIHLTPISLTTHTEPAGCLMAFSYSNSCTNFINLILFTCFGFQNFMCIWFRCLSVFLSVLFMIGDIKLLLYLHCWNVMFYHGATSHSDEAKFLFTVFVINNEHYFISLI